MKYTWKQYLKAQAIVDDFNKECSDIRANRLQIRYTCYTKEQVLYRAMQELSNYQYQLRKNNLDEFSKQFLKQEIIKSRNILFDYRKQYYKNK